MMRARSTLALCLLPLAGCGLVNSYDFDYSDTPVSPDAAGSGGSSAGSAGQGGTPSGGKAGTNGGGAGQGGGPGGAGANGGQAGDAGQAGASAGNGGAGNGGAGQGGSGGAGSGGAGSGGAGNGGVGGAGQAGAGQGGQGGAGQGGAGQAGAGQGGAGGCAQPTKWYKDGDFDGHGTPLLSSIDACTKPADEPGVYQWVTVADDCNDANSDVFPGQTQYFGVGYAKPGAPGNLSWDYDCDGKESPTAPLYAPNCGGLALGSCSGTGYVAYTPARSGTGIDGFCGSTHTITCGPQTIFCVAGAQMSAGALACR